MEVGDGGDGARYAKTTHGPARTQLALIRCCIGHADHELPTTAFETYRGKTKTHDLRMSCGKGALRTAWSSDGQWTPTLLARMEQGLAMPQSQSSKLKTLAPLA